MNIRNMAAFALIHAIAATSPVFASDNLVPKYWSVLNAEESQIQSREPVALTEVASLEQSNETNKNQLIVRNSHVVMFSAYGFSILERTASGLPKRHETFFNDSEYSSNSQVYASPDGKTLVWKTSSGFAELKVKADFSATYKMLSGLSHYNYVVSSKSSDSFVLYNYQTNIYSAYQVTDTGLELSGQLAVNPEIQNSNFLYNNKDKILVSIASSWDKLNVYVFKLKNGFFIETGRQELTASNYSNYPVYDIDTGRLVFQAYSGPYNVLQINGASGAIDSTGTTTEKLVQFKNHYDFSGIVSGDYVVANRYENQFLLYRDNNVFRERDTLTSSVTMAAHYNSETNRQEYWQNSPWSLQAHHVEQDKMLLLQERSSDQRGFPSLDRSTMITSDDNHYVMVQDNAHRVLLALDQNKTLKEVYRNTLAATGGHISSNAFIKVGQDSYLIAGSYDYRIVSINTQGLVVMSEPKKWPASVGSYLYDPQIKVKDGYIFLVNNGLKVLQLKNETLSVVQTLNDAALTTQDHQYIRAVVELDGVLFALMPASGKTARLAFKNNLLTVEKTGAMPNVDGPFLEGNNRVYTGGYPATVLLPDTEGNLKVNALSRNNWEGSYYKKRLKIARNFQPHQATFMLNDDITGVWQPLTISTDCCKSGEGLQLLDGHLLALGSANRQTLKLFKINTAPYLPAVVSTIQLNQGVASEVDIKAFIRDDENQPLTYSGLSAAGFSFTDANKLKFDGSGKGNGTVALTVSDGELLSDIKLPYQINAAPALLKPFPVIIANQNTQFSLDLNDYIEDPEGSAISFTAHSQHGLQLSKSGVISGSASTLQNITFELNVTDKAGATFKTALQLQVNAAPTLTGSAALSAKVGESFAIDLNTLVTDAEKHKINVAVTALPAGLSLNGAVISGTPTTQGSYNLQLTVTDELGARSVMTLSLNIAAEDKKSGGSLGWAWLVLLMLAPMRRLH
ncbi:putative Ig domain-containing protein [Rheinheimera sp. 4Y26]|uniref:putative Ig domain-containing protein n=1 Tax=Rheinheimera sp. 4Y26 TaxID=2977811 RepID=UPI0021B1085F|nr:putative Ig domain-containing protein [Rheinheimera sp. 4Y26]MCT6700509.1 putative Ig domain-containing protein [Rheinheimera sp. 4Y26]